MDDCVATTIKDKTKAVDKPLSIVDTMSLYADLFRTAAINYAYVRVGQAHKKHTHVKWKITDSACTECSNLQPIRIRRFTLGQMIPKHDTCVSCLEFIEEK